MTYASRPQRPQYSIIRSGQARLFSASSSLSALQPGQPAPDFGGSAVINGQLKQLKLAEYRGKYVVLFFYPADLYGHCLIITFSQLDS